MKNAYFLPLENNQKHSYTNLQNALDHLAFDQNKLIPVITQDADTKEVLMMAWMNREAITKTLEGGRMLYWSRSRNQFWEKGATSGHYQQLIEMRLDCDGDAILCLVKQTGAACHTGRKHCFYLRVDHTSNALFVISDIGNPHEPHSSSTL